MASKSKRGGSPFFFEHPAPAYRAWRSGILLLGFALSTMPSFGQEGKTNLRLGLNYGVGSQAVFPFRNPDYLYNHRYVKAQINFFLKEKSKWRWELNIEPSFYRSRCQLLNPYYIQPHFGADYLDQRVRFTKQRTLREYTLNIGLISRYQVMKGLTAYLLGSLGPLIGDQPTERLAKGFAFCDIGGLGASYRIKRVWLDIRFTLRHASNAGTQFPNYGHNSSCIESGFSIEW